MMLLLALACAEAPSPPPATVAYRAALVRLSSEPGAGPAACRGLPAGALLVDCLGVAAEGLARTDPQAATAVCASLDAGLWRDECHFQVAERSGDAARCAGAGRFEEDCRMHHWSRFLAGTLPRDATPASAEAALAAALPEAGFPEGDPRPWLAAFRLLGARMAPLDRALCSHLSSATGAKICRQALKDHYNDLLNHARDTGTFPCQGGPLTGRLAYRSDPGLDALVEERRAADLCP